MSNIMNFPIERTRQAPSMGKNRSSAEIVIFPGVRIERREFNLADRHDAAKVAKGKKTAGKRSSAD